jgi:hypothetical protein
MIDLEHRRQVIAARVRGLLVGETRVLAEQIGEAAHDVVRAAAAEGLAKFEETQGVKP